MTLQAAIVGNSLLRDVDLSVFDFVVIKTRLGIKDLLYVVEEPVRYTTKASKESRAK